jgi:hypothetical protein
MIVRVSVTGGPLTSVARDGVARCKTSPLTPSLIAPDSFAVAPIKFPAPKEKFPARSIREFDA